MKKKGYYEYIPQIYPRRLWVILVCVGLDRHNIASISFVHQLQHLLFGLGLNSEMEV